MKVIPGEMNTNGFNIFDVHGNKIPFVTFFDTQTCEVEILCPLSDADVKPGQTVVGTQLDIGFGAAKFRGVVPGAYLEIYGKRYDGK